MVHGLETRYLSPNALAQTLYLRLKHLDPGHTSREVSVHQWTQIRTWDPGRGTDPSK